MLTVTYHCFAVGLYNGLHNPPYVCAQSCSLYILLCIIDITCPRSAHAQISCAHNRACCLSSFLACSQLSNSNPPSSSHFLLLHSTYFETHGCGHSSVTGLSRTTIKLAWVINRSCSTQADPPTRMGHKPLLLSAGRPTWSYTAPALGRPTTRFVNAHSIEASYSARHSHSSKLTLLSFGVSRPARVCVYSIL